jgi:2-polyprenyl-3-methyl-5-hydroxy-6-metoxy-1,4-benzoquinol methylase
MNKTCAVCGDHASPHWQALDFWKCSTCGWMFRDPCPTAKELIELYDWSWREPEANKLETGGTTVSLARVAARRLAKSIGVTNFTGQRILDFGAGKGEMIVALTEMGAEAYALEPFGCEFLRRRGLRAFKSIDEIPRSLMFHGIVGIDVIEHLHTPWQEISQLRARLLDRGWIYLSTPNANGLGAKVKQEKWKQLTRPGHIVFFTSESLKKMLEKSGYTDARRLRWLISYPRNALRRMFQHALQLCAIDGELRYLAFNRAS